MVDTNFFKLKDILQKIVVIHIVFLVYTAVSIAGEPASEYLVDHEGYCYMETVESGSEIHIDGVLDEGAWGKANFQNQFLQREPNYGEQISEETLVAAYIISFRQSFT